MKLPKFLKNFPKPHAIAPGEMARLMAGINWQDASPCPRKAYVCSILSQWAYAEIPEFEFRHARLRMRRAKIFRPSELYAYLVAQKGRTTSSVREFISAEGPENMLRVREVVSNPFGVGVVLQTNNLIFIALRGTVNTRSIFRWPSMLSDLAADLDIEKWHPLAQAPNCGFHQGFFVAALTLFDGLRTALPDMASRPLIYVTGHSLGGGMAAILHAFWNIPAYQLGGKSFHKVHSAYTFGMPRFGDGAAMNYLWDYTKIDTYFPAKRTLHPYHFMHPWDRVPHLPPRFRNYYADSRVEWFSNTITGKAISSRSQRDGGSKRSFKYHGIEEIYIPNIKKLSDNTMNLVF